MRSLILDACMNHLMKKADCQMNKINVVCHWKFDICNKYIDVKRREKLSYLMSKIV